MQNYSYINCSCITYAQKAIKLLNNNGISAWSKKVAKKECGCGWVVYVYEQYKEQSIQILKEGRVPIKPVNIEQ